ncbi:MAG: hypothetical protein HFI63_02495 [Lachnospiraceae bacterium]|nr:hypothetical protein [Lachnospiraceae bacterium]
MYYAVYVVGMIFYIVYAIGFWGDFRVYADSGTALFILVPCVLLLFCTRSLRAFGRSVLFAFGKRDYGPSECGESFQAVKMTLYAVLVLGVLGFLISMINSIRGWKLQFLLDGVYDQFQNLAVAMLAPFYALLVCAFLLPIFFILKKHLTAQGHEENGKHLK